MKIIFLCFASLLLCVSILLPQSNLPSFERLTQNDGLAANDIRALLQDRFGFIWIGTADGLNVFDGYGFVHYQHSPFDSTAMPANAVTALYEDRDGALWIGTVSGLARMNFQERAAGRFHQYWHDPDDPKSLSHNAISSFCEDADGNLWIGTFGGGLNKLDRQSNTFIHYRRKAGNSFGLNDDIVLALHLDRAGTFWAGTLRGGLQRFDPRTERFTTFTWHHPKYLGNYRRYVPQVLSFVDSLKVAQPPLAALLQINNNEDRQLSFALDETEYVLIIATGEGISTPLADYGWLERQGSPRPVWQMPFERTMHAGGALKNRLMIEIVKLQQGNYLLHYRSDDSHAYQNWNNWPPEWPNDWGIQMFALNAAGAGKLLDDLRQSYTPTALSYNRVTCIAADPNSDSRHLWIGTGDGLNRFDPLTETFVNYFQNPDDPVSLSDNAICAITPGDSGRLWIGTETGLDQFDPKQNHFSRFKTDDELHRELPKGKIRAVLTDRSGLVWIATARNGLFKQSSQKFAYSRVAEDTEQNQIYSICLDQEKKIWLGTSKGLLVQNADGSLLRHFTCDERNLPSLSANIVTFIHEDRAGTKWIGTVNGLNRMQGDGKFAHFYSSAGDSTTLSSNLLYCVAESRDGALWIGTTFGLNRFDPRNGKATRYLHDPNNPASLPANDIGAVLVDRSGALWVGTVLGGVSKLDPATGLIKNYLPDPANQNGLCNRSINTLYEDHRGTLWIGTYSGGLCKLTRDAAGREKFSHFTVKDGLPSNKILGILEDENRNLWLSTNRGLARFDPAAPEGKKVRIFSARDGVQDLQFYRSACFAACDSEMFFGGANGFNRFFPQQVKDEPYAPPVVLTQFKLFDHVKQFDLPLPALPAIQLQHNENFFSLEFAALDYHGTENVQYAYKLEGLEEEWTYCGSRRYANYTNVDPGQYVFRVKASNNDGVWNEQGASIRLVVAPPFWRTWWFYALAALVFAISAYLLHEHRLRRKIKQSLQLERVRFAEREKVREQISRDYHDEMGHQITKISIFSEVIKRQVNGNEAELAGYLSKVTDASQNLCVGARDFIWTLNPEKDSLYDLVLHLKEFGDALFDDSDIAFEVYGLGDELARIRLSMEWKRHLTLIFKEAMNNVLRHSHATNAALRIDVKQHSLQIALADDGAGVFSTNGHARNGNGLENMKKRAEILRGKLEILASPVSGTTVRFEGEIPSNGY